MPTQLCLHPVAATLCSKPLSRECSKACPTCNLLRFTEAPVADNLSAPQTDNQARDDATKAACSWVMSRHRRQLVIARIQQGVAACSRMRQGLLLGGVPVVVLEKPAPKSCHRDAQREAKLGTWQDSCGRLNQRKFARLSTPGLSRPGSQGSQDLQMTVQSSPLAREKAKGGCYSFVRSLQPSSFSASTFFRICLTLKLNH